MVKEPVKAFKTQIFIQINLFFKLKSHSDSNLQFCKLLETFRCVYFNVFKIATYINRIKNISVILRWLLFHSMYNTMYLLRIST